MPKVVDQNGTELDASFSVEAVNDAYGLIIESSGGKRGHPSARNLEYAPGLLVLLRRLRELKAVIEEVVLQRTREHRPLDERRLELEGFSFPLQPNTTTDLAELRHAITRAQARGGRNPERQRGGGNPRKRIRMLIRLPEGLRPSPEGLASLLAAPLPSYFAQPLREGISLGDEGRPATIIDVQRQMEAFATSFRANPQQMRNWMIFDSHWIYDVTDDVFAPAAMVGGSGYSDAALRAVRTATSSTFHKSVKLSARLRSWLGCFGDDFRPFVEDQRLRFLEVRLPHQSSKPRLRHSLRPFKTDRTRRVRQLHDVEVNLALTNARLEKAIQEHEALLQAIHQWLISQQWSGFEEDPDGSDLVATHPTKVRVIFEVKTIEGNEAAQVRAAIGQLFEYRHFDGALSDRLCVVVNRPISVERLTFLNSLDIMVVTLSENGWSFLGPGAEHLFAA